MLMGLPIDGNAITRRVRNDHIQLCEMLLGTSPVPPDINYSLVHSSWFKEIFSELPEQVDETTLHRHTRAYILQLCSTVLFPTVAIGKINMQYL